MIERIRAVNNPLTIIAIFAALAEIAGTVALAAVDVKLQTIFVWFVMGFPTILVILFFITLNFNPRVLYAPSDFRNEENFLNMVLGKNVLTARFASLTQQLDEAKDQIIKEAIDQIGAATESERQKMAAVVTTAHFITSKNRVFSIENGPFGRL